MDVGLVAIPGMFGSSFTSVLDIVGVSESLRPSVDPAIEPLRCTVIGLSARMSTSGGMIVEAERTLDDPMDDLDVLVIPTLGALTPTDLAAALALPEVRALTGALRDGSPLAVPTLAGACSGTFVLAAAGRLDGIRATTCWWLADAFRRRYPKVELDQTRMVIRSGGILTAGAAFAHIDLALSLVASVSDRLAETVAHHMLVDERPAHLSQALLGHLSETDSLVTGFEDEVRARLGEPFTIPELADALNVTRRTLERRVRLRTGLAPAELVRRLRLERALHLRRTTELSMDQIAGRVGYSGAVTLGRALARDDT